MELCTLYLPACQVRVIVGDSGFCCCVCVTSFERESSPLFTDCSQSDSFIPKSIHWLMKVVSGLRQDVC